MLRQSHAGKAMILRLLANGDPIVLARENKKWIFHERYSSAMICLLLHDVWSHIYINPALRRAPSYEIAGGCWWSSFAHPEVKMTSIDSVKISQINPFLHGAMGYDVMVTLHGVMGYGAMVKSGSTWCYHVAQAPG
jgi:hypothetical protein